MKLKKTAPYGAVLVFTHTGGTMTDEEQIATCQKEIRRLRAVIRNYAQAHEAMDINYQNLFDLWSDFDNAEASDEVLRIIETSTLAPVDAVSFTAFCYGYEQAIRHITQKEGETNEP